MKKMFYAQSIRRITKNGHLTSFFNYVQYLAFSLSFVLLACFFIPSMPVLATKSLNTISGEVTISPSLNVTIPSSTVSLNLNPLNTDFDSANLNVTISTNNPSGYTLTMSPVLENTTSLTRVSGTETIPTLTEKTGGYTESEFTTNTWGYKLSTTNYLTFKNTNDITTTNTPANNDVNTVTFAAKADNTIAAGTYQLEITFTAIANPLPEPTTTPGKITYNPNSGTVIGQMGNQSAADGNTVTLYAPNFKNPGYGFAGWNTQADGLGDKLGPNEDYTIPTGTSTNGLTLYAMWIKSQGTMQNWTCPNNTTMPVGTVTALTDNRDGDTYAVAKLADNKCWMIENLRLDDSAELSNTNTNNPALPLTNTDGTASNHLSTTTDPTQTAWCTDNSSACNDQSMLNTDNITLFVGNTSSSQGGYIYSYGNYYNWYSATAGNGKYSTTSTNTSGDICPYGWHLPTGNASGDYAALDVALGGNGTNSDPNTAPTGAAMSMLYRTFPNNFVYSGFLSGGSSGSRNKTAAYWSSTASGNNGYASYLYVTNTYARPGRSTFQKYSGWTVRCILGAN